MPRLPGIRRLFRFTHRDARLSANAVDDELRFHLESRVEELVALGIGRTDAHATALREIGDWKRYRDDCIDIDARFAREAGMRELMRSIWDDVRYSVRALRFQPGFFFVAAFTLSLGIGATTSVFSAVSGVLLRPLPYVDANRIVHVGERKVSKPGRGGTTSYDNFDDWRRTSSSFADIAIVANATATLTGRGDPERVGIARVSSGMFSVFHVRPYLGRAFTEADNLPSASAVVLLSYDFWKTRFGANPAVIGTSIELNLVPVLVVGVLPPGFAGPERLGRAIWTNFVNDTTDGRGGRSKEVYALLRPGVTIARAQNEMTTIGAQLERLYPKDDKGETVVVESLSDRTVGDLRRPLYLLLGASFLVLLIACANLSNLLLARGLARQREMAVRAALGADRSRLVRQLLTESTVLGFSSAAVGVAIAIGVIRVLSSLGPDAFAARPPELSVGALVTSLAVSALTTLTFGLIPALRTSPRSSASTLREGGSRTSAGTSRRTRTVLAVMQLSFAVVLLSSSTLVIESFVRVLRVEPGIRGDHLLTAALTLPAATYGGEQSTRFYEQVAQQLRATPGVRDVAFTNLVPFSGDYDRVNITQIRGEAERVGADAATADRYVVSPSYFGAMGVRLERGRLFAANDGFNVPTVCVVDEVFARKTFGERDPIGQVLTIPPSREATIVGVVTHVKTYGLDVDSPGQLYLSNEQVPWRWSSVVVRTTTDPETFVPAIARIVRSLDAGQAVSNPVTMDRMMSKLLRARRFTLALFAAFAVVAVVLAVIGLYGVIAYGVSQRRREFAVRLALGARPTAVAKSVLVEGGRVTAAGIAIGLAGAWIAGRSLSTLMFEVSAHDARTFGAVAIGLMAVALVACIVPARRATSVAPAEVLRGE